jgi:hypothetical protein
LRAHYLAQTDQVIQDGFARRLRKTGVPGFMVCLYLYFWTVHRPETQAASHSQEETVTRISRTVRFIPQVLLDTLR